MRGLKSTTTFTSTSMDVNSGSEPITTTTAAAAAVMQRSPWHSPVLYLFGGLAAMLGLIAFALLVLACSYWKLSGQLNSDDDDDDDEDEKKCEDLKVKERVVYEEQFVVIMAGDDQPTCLAMPSRSTAAILFNLSNENADEKTATAAAAAAHERSI